MSFSSSTSDDFSDLQTYRKRKEVNNVMMMFGSVERVMSMIEGRNGDTDILTQREKGEELDLKIFDGASRKTENLPGKRLQTDTRVDSPISSRGE